MWRAADSDGVSYRSGDYLYMTDIIVEIRGGNLVACYSSDPQCIATIVDWDNLEAGVVEPMRVQSLEEISPDTRIQIESGYTHP